MDEKCYSQILGKSYQSPIQWTEKEAADFVQWCLAQKKRIADQWAARWNQMQQYEHEADNDFRHRQTPDSIWQKHNYTLNFSRYVAETMRARLGRDILSSGDWLEFDPVGLPRFNVEGQDESEAAKVYPDLFRRHIDQKLKETTLEDSIEEALEMASDTGYCVIKAFPHREVTYYRAQAAVVLGDDGKPVTDSQGDYVVADEAEWVPMGKVEENRVKLATLETASSRQAFLEQIEAEHGRDFRNLVADERLPVPLVLDRDEAVIRPSAEILLTAQKWVRREVVHYSGPRSCCVHYRNLFIDQTDKSIEASPFVAEFRQASKINMLQKYADPDWLEKQIAKYGSIEKVALMTFDPDAVNDRPDMAPIERGGSDIEDATRQPSSGDSSTDATLPDQVDPTGKFIEVFCTYRDPKLRRPVKMFAIIEEESGVLLYDNYTYNITINAQTPYFSIRRRAKKNRWWGIGDYEYNHAIAEWMDKQINRLEMRNNLRGMVRGYDPSVCRAWQYSPPVMGTETSYKLEEGMSIQQGVQVLQFPDMDGGTWNLLNFVMQQAQLTSGQLNPAAGNASGSPITELARGISAIEEARNELYSLAIERASKDIERLAEYMCRLYYAEMPDGEAVEFWQDDPEGGQYVQQEIRKEHILQTKFEVRVMLTKLRSKELQQRLVLVMEVINQFIALPPQWRQKFRPVFEDMLSNLEYEKGAKMLSQSPEEIQQEMMMLQQQASGGGEPEPATIEIPEGA